MQALKEVVVALQEYEQIKVAHDALPPPRTNGRPGVGRVPLFHREMHAEVDAANEVHEPPLDEQAIGMNLMNFDDLLEATMRAHFGIDDDNMDEE